MSSESILRKSPLDAEHREHGARLVPFAGFQMPIQYSGIVEEVCAVRERAGIFDVSHMGRLFVSGAEAADLLRSVHTYNVQRIAVDSGHYSLLCDESGGILDDPYVYHLGEQRWLMIPNASRNDEDIDWLREHLRPGMDARLDDRRESTVMVALQGPRAAEILGSVLSAEIPARVQRRRATEIELYGYKAFLSRTGYTGEDGFEIVCAIDAGRHFWDHVIAAGATACGLGARDVLRLEAALALYGNDIDVSTNPYEAGLGWVVSMKDADFSGKTALAHLKERVDRRLVCFTADNRAGVFRHGYSILHGGEPAGVVTSGGFSPTLKTSIGMGYVPASLAAEGNELSIEIRGRPAGARIVPRPFVPHHG
ncbi:MAG: glycine cleavage system aminomethyltransferase GcvT [Dehalococcoidia bacterium]